jgi:hypothetical protein
MSVLGSSLVGRYLLYAQNVERNWFIRERNCHELNFNRIFKWLGDCVGGYNVDWIGGMGNDRNKDGAI